MYNNTINYFRNTYFSTQLSIPNTQTALTQMPIGATWELYVPYALGYGDRGTGPIPPYSALIFKITLLGKK